MFDEFDDNDFSDKTNKDDAKDDGVRTVNPVSFDKPWRDSTTQDFDFRPLPVIENDKDVTVPKDFSVTVSVDTSATSEALLQENPESPADPAGAVKAKS